MAHKRVAKEKLREKIKSEIVYILYKIYIEGSKKRGEKRGQIFIHR